ncbi:MAG: LysR substrate-binding domain-containing protein, partial [Steroidobacteraceae bacterium]
SSRIAQLEKSLGCRLFDRSTRSVRLTRAARDILPSVERILGDTEALIGQTKDISAGVAGRVVMAALPSISATVLPSAISQFLREHPRISIVLRDALAEGMADMVRNDEVDFAISSPIVGDTSFDFTLLTSDRMAAVFPRKHPLQSVSSLKLEQLIEYPLILMDRSSSVRHIIEDAFRAKGRAALPAFEVAFMSTAIGMVRAGLGVTVLPSASLEVQSATDLGSRNFAERILMRKIGILKRQGRSMAPAVEKFTSFLISRSKRPSR